MQSDFFENTELTRIKHLKERKQQLKEELEKVEEEIVTFVEKGNSYPIGENLRIARHVTNNVIIYNQKWSLKKDRVTTDFMAIVRLDLLRRAMQSLSQETQNESKGIPGSYGSSPPNSPW